MGTLLAIVMVILMIKLAAWLLDICGDILGLVFGVLGFLLAAFFAVMVFGCALVLLPVLLLVVAIWVIACAVI